MVRGGDLVVPGLRPPQAFDTASRMVVDYLAQVVPMGAWAVTRVVDEQQTMLVTADRRYGLMVPGAAFPWSTSMCRLMAMESLARIVPDTHAEPRMADAVAAAEAQAVAVGAYVGTPIVRSDGELFGTVCGYNPEPLPDGLVGREPLLTLLSSLLSSVLEADTAATESARALERAVVDSETDALTGLLNRRGWERWLMREEDRHRRFGETASVVVLDLDLLKQINDTRGHDAGDRYIRAAADTLRATTREADALARLGGDEFAMVVHCVPGETVDLVTRLENALAAAGVRGSFGVAPYSIAGGFPGAVAAADRAMYRNKWARRLRRG